MAAPAAIDLIRPALRRNRAIGALEQPSAKQISAAMDCLLGLIDTWQTLPMTWPKPVETIVTLPANTPLLTIGVGQQIDVPRPIRIESAYGRVSGIDRPIGVATKQQWDSIDLKALGSTWPELLYYDKGSPDGKVYFWPLGSGDVEVHITTGGALLPYELPTDTQELPPGGQRALWLALAVESAPMFGVPVDQLLAAAAVNAFAAMSTPNVIIPDLDLEGVQQPATATSRLGTFIGGGF